ncbi:MAG: sugar-binding protein [Armatimonadota bacterium]
MLADNANRYVGFECFDSDTAHLRARVLPDENGLNSDVPTDDSVEIYVDPRAGGSYLRRALNSLGAAKASAAGGWQVATKVEADRWLVEVRIPFALIGAAPAAGEVWGFNACRNDQSSGESTAWSCTEGGYANPERFGGLLFLQ